MNSVAKAIVWELWSRNRLALVALLVGLPIALIPGREWFRVFQALYFMFAIAILFWTFCYVEVDSRGRHAGFPSRMFVLPLPTGVLAGLPMICGACTIALFYLFWSQIVLPLWDVRLASSWLRVHLLALVAMLLSLQTIVWSFYRFPWFRLFLLLTVLVAIGIIGIGVPGDDFRKMSEAQTEVTLAVIIGVAFLTGIAGVARDRRGEWEGWTQGVIDTVMNALPRGRSAFRSAADAQVWFEWRGKGMFLCIVLVISMLGPLILWPVPMALGFDAGPSASFYLALPLIALCAAWSLGIALATTDYSSMSSRTGLSSFITTRPLTSGDIVVAKVKGAALVTIAGSVLFALFAVPVFNISHWWLSSEDRNFPSFAEFVRGNRELILTISHPAIVLTAFFVMWTTMVDTLALGLKSHRARLVQSILKVGLVCAALILTAWALETPRGRSLLLHALPWIAALMIVWKVATTVAAIIRTQRLYSSRQLAALVALWLITALLLLWTGAILWTDNTVIDRIILFLGALLLPGALPRAAISLDRSRHA